MGFLVKIFNYPRPPRGQEGNQVTATISVGKDDQGYFYNESSINIDTIPPNLTVTGPMGPYDGFKDINFVVTTSDNSSILLLSQRLNRTHCQYRKDRSS